jgi:hypothetical protein
MKRIFLASIILLSTRVLAAADGPDVSIKSVGGAPQIAVANASCPPASTGNGLRQRIIDAAAKEWALFEFPRFSLLPLASYNVIPPGLSPDVSKTRTGRASLARVMPIGLMEDASSVRAAIGRYWLSVPKGTYDYVFERQNVIWAQSGGRAGWAEYWSAAFVSYVMCVAGLGTNDLFQRSNWHVDYIKAAIDKLDGKRPQYAYKAYDVGAALPEPGDLICAAREDPDRTITDLESFRENSDHTAFHCDIVVGYDNRRPEKAGVLYAIGGNVINAVSLTETPLRKGRLTKIRGPHGRNWFAVLKLDIPAGSGRFQRIPAALLTAAEAMAKKWKN